jgi:hypothetical protein
MWLFVSWICITIRHTLVHNHYHVFTHKDTNIYRLTIFKDCISKMVGFFFKYEHVFFNSSDLFGFRRWLTCSIGGLFEFLFKIVKNLSLDILYNGHSFIFNFIFAWITESFTGWYYRFTISTSFKSYVHLALI